MLLLFALVQWSVSSHFSHVTLDTLRHMSCKCKHCATINDPLVKPFGKYVFPAVKVLKKHFACGFFFSVVPLLTQDFIHHNYFKYIHRERKIQRAQV